MMNLDNRGRRRSTRPTKRKEKRMQEKTETAKIKNWKTPEGGCESLKLKLNWPKKA
jgi:hypothetical protein